MNPVTEDILIHYGIKRRSGRYPWGSGEDPYQHGRDFLGRVDELRKQNFTWTDEDGKTYTGDTAIAKSMGLSTTQFRTEIGLAKDERRMLLVARLPMTAPSPMILPRRTLLPMVQLFMITQYSILAAG